MNMCSTSIACTLSRSIEAASDEIQVNGNWAGEMQEISPRYPVRVAKMPANRINFLPGYLFSGAKSLASDFRIFRRRGMEGKEANGRASRLHFWTSRPLTPDQHRTDWKPLNNQICTRDDMLPIQLHKPGRQPMVEIRLSFCLALAVGFGFGFWLCFAMLCYIAWVELVGRLGRR